jgi:hypothetical protein
MHDALTYGLAMEIFLDIDNHRQYHGDQQEATLDDGNVDDA